MRFFSILFPVVSSSSSVDPCTDLCNFNGPSICSGGSWTKRDNSCHAYVFRGDPALGDYCYHTSATSSYCPASTDPVRPQDVALLMYGALPSDDVVGLGGTSTQTPGYLQPEDGTHRRFGTMVELLSNFTVTEELCNHLHDLSRLISTAVREGSHLTASEFWFHVGGPLMFDAAMAPSSCQDALALSFVSLVTNTPHALDNPVRFSSDVWFTRFCREHTARLRRLIITTSGSWADVPRFVPFLFNTVSLRQKAAADLIFRFQAEQLHSFLPQEPVNWCDSLGYRFYQRSSTEYFELDLDLPFSAETRSLYTSIGECLGISLSHNAPIGRQLPRWFFNKLLNNRVTMSDLELDDPELFRTLRGVERGGRGVVRGMLGLEADEPVPDVADYLADTLAALAPPEAEERFEAIREGLSRLAPIQQLRMIVSAEDLRTLTVGDPGISVDDLIDHSVIDRELSNSPIVEWLWDWLRQAPLETRRNFLNFVIGSMRLPLAGAIDLPHPITISLTVNLAAPRADHFIFLLELPSYTSPLALASGLVNAVTPPEYRQW